MKTQKKKFYIYGHYTADTDTLFYVGKGSGRRAWKKSGRAKQNPHWGNVANKHGYVVKLIEEGLTEKKAFQREMEIIAEIGLENLTNMTSGGDGFTSEDAQKLFTQNPEWRRNNKEANQKLAQDPEWRRNNKEATQRRSQNPEWCRKQREHGKKLAKQYGKVISPTGQIYDVHNLKEFCRVHDLHRPNMQHLFQGKRNHHRGWKLYVPPTDIFNEYFTF